MKCYICDANIQQYLSFCPSCNSPLVPCSNLECSKYFSPLANFCTQCSSFIGSKIIPQHYASESTKLEDLLNLDENLPIIVTHHLLDGEFNTDPLIALGYLFIVSESGHIWILNPKTLEEYKKTEITQLSLTEINASPIAVRYMEKLDDGSDICRHYLFIASGEEMLRLSIEYRSKDRPIVLCKPKSLRLDGECLTNPIYLDGKVIVGTDMGLMAYNIDGEKVWQYENFLPDEIISTQSVGIDNRIIFGTHSANLFRIHAVNATNGKADWKETYTFNSDGIRDIHFIQQTERLIFLDDYGKLHNIDFHGDKHYSPKSAKIANRPTATGFSKGNIYAITTSGGIHCLDSFGGMSRPHRAIGGGRQLFFHSRSAVGKDFIVFVSHNGTLLFIRTERNSSNIMDIEIIAEALPQGEIISQPIISDGCLYILSENGSLIKMTKNG